MKNYEVMYIINASLEDDKRAELVSSMHDVIANNGGTVGKVDEWGVRTFAYPIDHMTKGYYVVTKFAAEPECVAEFDRVMGLNKYVVRHMITVDQAA